MTYEVRRVLWVILFGASMGGHLAMFIGASGQLTEVRATVVLSVFGWALSFIFMRPDPYRWDR